MDDTPAPITPDRLAVPRPRTAPDDAVPARSPEMIRLSQPLTFAPRRTGRRVWALALVAVTAIAVIATISLQGPAPDRPISVGDTLPTVSAAATTSAPPAPPTVDSVLAAQGGALVSGDRAGFLRPVAHADAKTRKLYGMLYANLRALHVARWSQIATEDGYHPAGSLHGVRTEHLTVIYCFGDVGCAATSMAMVIKIHTAGRTAEIVSATAPAVATTPYSKYTRVPPWALAPLHFVSKGNVILAATTAEASALKSTLTIAVRAAVVADRYAHWTKPHLYVLYLASTSEFKKWFTPDDPNGNILGYIHYLSAGDSEVTLAMSRAASYPEMGGVAGTLQHEFGHVATVAGLDPYGSSRLMERDDTLVEGIAELCAYDGHPSWGTARYPDVRAFIRAGKWSGHPMLTKELDSSDIGVVSAAYGIGYLAMRRLAERFGLTRALNFWGAVERDDVDPDHASRTTFGVAWKTLEADIKAYVKRTVHA